MVWVSAARPSILEPGSLGLMVERVDVSAALGAGASVGLSELGVSRSTSSDAGMTRGPVDRESRPIRR
jgi:hypothetical protein